ncbi:MAG: MBL fold metallo-hydrolase [Lentisphaerae bacterium]|nr:MBL fold metallo-hydrolase [Lentisphaerota bacterium]
MSARPELGTTKSFFRKVRPELYWFHPPDGGELHVVVTKVGLVLVDSGLLRHREVILGLWRQAGLDPRKIRLGFMTHFHADHVGAMGWWSREFGFSVVAHANAAKVVEKGDLVITGTKIPYAGFDEDFVPCPIRHKVVGGERFPVGKHNFKVSAAPGHTVGSIHILCGDLLFVGDTLFADGSIGWMDVHWGSNPEDYVHTLEQMRPLCGALCAPGHGPPFRLSRTLIKRACKIVSFYIPLGHGLGFPRVPRHSPDRAR